MSARHRHFLAALAAAISISLSTGSAAPPVPASSIPAGTGVHYCPVDTAWDDYQHRCI